jgi:uncharacterized protein (TIGR03382 family)
MSVQRQGDGTYQVATPTPNTANIAGSTIKACPTDPIDTVSDDLPLIEDAPRDAGNGNNGGGGGCCQTSNYDAPGAIVLALATLLGLRRRRG